MRGIIEANQSFSDFQSCKKLIKNPPQKQLEKIVECFKAYSS